MGAPPTPAVTKNVSDFRMPGMDDTEMIKAALKWAHARPASAGETSGLCATELWVTADTSDMLQPGI